METFVDEIYSKARKKNYITKKTSVSQFDVTWSLGILVLKDYGPDKNKGGHRYALVVMDYFSRFGWLVLLKKNAQSITKFFEEILKSSERKPNL